MPASDPTSDPIRFPNPSKQSKPNLIRFLSSNPSNSGPHFPIPERERHRGIERESERRRWKFLKPNKAVVVLQGRYAGRKAVIVRSFDEDTRDRSYGHCLVAGLSKYPRKVIRKDSAKKQAKKSRVKCFIKLVNYNHIMPTRYTLDVDLKDIVNVDVLQSKDKKVTAAKETKARFEERFKTRKKR